MLCQNCGKNEANIQYTQIINGIKKEITLCGECAKHLKLETLDFNLPMNFSSFFGDLLEEYEDNSFLSSFSKKQVVECDYCHRTYNQFIEEGKLGCPMCYEVFAARLDPILKNIHGNNRHIGRKPDGRLSEKSSFKQEEKQEEIKPEKNNELEKLKEELKKKIKEEAYEEAAKIRDQIKEMENNKPE